MASRLFSEDHITEIRLNDDRLGLLVMTRDREQFARAIGQIALDGHRIDGVVPADENVDALYEYLIGGEQVDVGGARGAASFSARARQAWTIARIELRRAFFARRGLWVYALALLPSIVFSGHGLDAKWRIDRLSRRGLTDPVLMDSVQKGETIEAVKARLGKPAEERGGTRVRRVRKTEQRRRRRHMSIDSAVAARFVRLNISRPTYSGQPVATIYEFEVYGADGQNLALGRPATGSAPCRADRGPEKAVNGSVAGGQADSWCADDYPFFLQVDLGAARPVKRFVVKHASAGGESEEFDTRDFNIQVSADGKTFTNGRDIVRRRLRR